jgi:FkbM family methyltransferase
MKSPKNPLIYLRKVFHAVTTPKSTFLKVLNSDTSVSSLIKILTPKYVNNVYGNKMYLDDRDWKFLFYSRVHEPQETEFFLKTIKTGDVVLDIGANIGYFTLLFANAVGSNGHVYAFEPDRANFKILRKNVEVNHCKNVTLINKAVWSKNEILKLYLSLENIGDHRTYKSINDREFIEVQGVRIDDYLSHIHRGVDVIKMDIQGAEFHAISGMRNILSMKKDVILVSEFWPFGLNLCGVSAPKYLELLKSNGFALYELGDEGDYCHIEDEHDFLKRYSVQNKRFSNIVCKRT